MFGIGIPELIVILVLALIFVGPRKLPEIAKTLGKALAELRRAADDVKRSIDTDYQEISKPEDYYPDPYDTKTRLKPVEGSETPEPPEPESAQDQKPEN